MSDQRCLRQERFIGPRFSLFLARTRALHMRLAPFTLPQFFALPLASVAQLVNQPCFLVLGEGTSDLGRTAALGRLKFSVGRRSEA